MMMKAIVKVFDDLRREELREERRRKREEKKKWANHGGLFAPSYPC